ncbi:uncharacterized protein [Typha angustifolia]|uniref:uncharacterized protein n=1 Tax=Typha angustifolia TaxID=59011 RepID=UPI003C2E02C9
MGIDPSLSPLLRNLKVDNPWTPPRTWESIPSESGAPRSDGSGQGFRDPIYESASVYDGALVRLSIYALQGVKSALVEIEEVCKAFCSDPADRTSHRVPNLWCRSSSTNALGHILRSISWTGLVVFSLRKFVNFYLFPSQNVTRESREGAKDEDFHCNDVGKEAPYSLVNQAFSVAVKKVLEGYISALDTLLASVKLRRSMQSKNAPSCIANGASGNNSTGYSEITILEVYLHTEELRRYIGSIGNICFPKFADLSLSREDLMIDTNLEFHSFPKGADLLSYLYVQLRDADPVHRGLLKYLFICSCEPYCGFIKSWIYRASIEDPYAEFLVAYLDDLLNSNCNVALGDDMSLISVKERNNVSVPCFLKDVSRPLLRAGQQLQVLVKLLNLCNLSIISGGAFISSDLANLEEILPCWFDSSGNSRLMLNSLTFSKKGIETLVHKREVMYKTMLEKVQNVFSKFDIRYQLMNHTVNPYGTAPNFLGKRSMNIPAILVSDEDLMHSANANRQSTIIVNASRKDTEASYTSDESSYEGDPLQVSEFSSSCSSRDENEDEIDEFCDNVSQSNLSSYYASTNGLQIRTEKLFPAQVSIHSINKGINPSITIHQHYEDKKSSRSPFSIQSSEITYSSVHRTLDEDYQYLRCWPLGLLLKNPLYSNMNCLISDKMHSSEETTCTTYENTDSLEKKESPFGDVLFSSSSKLDPLMLLSLTNDRNRPQPSHLNQSLDTNFSTNPMLTKAAWFHRECVSRDRNHIKNQKQLFPCFDFSSIVNPCEVYSGNMCSSPHNGSQVEAPVLVSSGISTCKVHEKSADFVQDNAGSQEVPSLISSSKEATPILENLPPNASGGAGWVGSLKYSGDVKCSTGYIWHGSEMVSEIPIDVVIDKCIMQEILLQYKYVSNFTIKLLEERFDLPEHLLALRRYHFMELADWADLFIVSLCHQKWSNIEPERKIVEIQSFLDLALQRSSCESDPYKERLYVYMKEQSVIPLSTSATGLNVFDSMILGYKVDWPISIIITPDALKKYATIFGYLIQVRLAVFSLTDTWCILKATKQSICRCRHMGSNAMKDFNASMRIRQQIYHFVSTLQQYVHSQLSDVSWFRFQDSMKHQVKDMLDLESLHMSYLADAMYICFLSVETKSIAAIIKNILQCAMDFRLCFGEFDLDAGSETDPLNLQSNINFSQVFAINTVFEKNLKDLYLLYLKSPKHGEFSLSRFWGYLNYNDHYSSTIKKDMGYFHL